MTRIEAIRIIMGGIQNEVPVIAANGMISREVHAVANREGNFYMLGSMGLASSIGLGIVLASPSKRVIVLDGDGNLLMNLGSLTTVGSSQPNGMIHIILDNESYESTGGQPSVSKKARLEKIAKIAGYKYVSRLSSKCSLKRTIKKLFNRKGPVFLLVKIADLSKSEKSSRIELHPTQIKNRFMKHLCGRK